MLSSNSFNSLFDLIQAFPDKESCIKKLEKLIWNNNPVSPFDATSKVYKCKNNRYKCTNTDKYFSVLNGTIFEGTKIELKKWFMTIYIEASHRKGISSHQLAKDIGVTQKTAWFMLHRVRAAIQNKSFSNKLNGFVEADETFVGGKNKNRHKDKKVEQCQGRAYKDKTPVFGLMERNEFVIVERPSKINPDKAVKEKVITKQSVVYCEVVPDTKSHSIQPIIFNKVERGSRLMTDEWWAYSGLGIFYDHRVVFHSRKQYVDGDTHSNTMEGFWGIFKRGIIGIYHWVSKKHLQKYVNEFVFRYNTKHLAVEEKMDLFLSNLTGSRLLYKQLIA